MRVYNALESTSLQKMKDIFPDSIYELVTDFYGTEEDSGNR